jgi:hypothetical protein
MSGFLLRDFANLFQAGGADQSPAARLFVDDFQRSDTAGGISASFTGL